MGCWAVVLDCWADGLFWMLGCWDENVIVKRIYFTEEI